MAQFEQWSGLGMGASGPILRTASGIVLASCVTDIAWADPQNADLIQGQFVYAGFFLAILAASGPGVAAMLFSFRVHPYIGRVLCVGGAIMVCFQYMLIWMDLQQYEGAFTWDDSFLLPWATVFDAEAMRDLNTIFGLWLPSVIIALSTLMIPVCLVKQLMRSVQTFQQKEEDSGSNSHSDEEVSDEDKDRLSVLDEFDDETDDEGV